MDTEDEIDLNQLPHPQTEVTTPPSSFETPIDAQPLQYYDHDATRKCDFTSLDDGLIRATDPKFLPGDLELAQALVGLGVKVRPPGPEGKVVDPSEEGYFGIHLSSLLLGLMFPLHPMLVDILNYYQLELGQLVPNPTN